MELVIGYLVSCIPGILLLLWIRKRVLTEEKHRERTRKAFLRGILSVLTVMLFSTLFNLLLAFTVKKDEHFLLYTLLRNFIATAFSEELSKYLACRQTLKKDAPDASILETVVYMTLSGLGFGFIESIVYAIDTGVIHMIVRGVTMMHSTYGFMLGRFIGKSRATGKKIYTMLGLMLTTFLHGLYDFCLNPTLNEKHDWLGFISLVLAVVSLVYVFVMIRYMKKKRELEEYTAPLPADTAEPASET